jgi:dsRNA-specific ribonuclease
MKTFCYLLVFATILFPGLALGSKPLNHIDPNDPSIVRQTNAKLEKVLGDIQGTIGYRFKDVSLLELSLRRNASDIGHSRPATGYERLAFLGDKVLKVLVTEKLWREYHDFPVHKAKQRASVILQNATFGDLNRKLHLTEKAYIAGVCDAPALNAHDQGDHIESLFGALYYDGSFSGCAPFFRASFSETSISPAIQSVFKELSEHYKPMKSQIQDPLMPEKLAERHQTWDLFLGEALLDLALTDFLCARYPLIDRGRLNDSVRILFSADSVDLILKHVYSDWKQMSFIACLGLMFMDTGYQSVYDYVTWLYTCPQAPDRIAIALNKGAADEEANIRNEKPFLVMGPPKTVLDQLLPIIGKKAFYANVKSGQDHSPRFEAHVSCEDMFRESATALTKSDAEGIACQQALRRLASHFLANVLSSDALDMRDINFWIAAQALVEWQLFDLGFKGFSYFPLGCLDSGRQVFYRHEIQGAGLIPARGEGRSPQEAKAKALSASLKLIIDKINNDQNAESSADFLCDSVTRYIGKKQLIEYRDPLNILLQVIGLMGIEQQWEEIKYGLDNAPTFAVNLKGPFFKVWGQGRTKAEAVKAAAIHALERIKTRGEVLKLSNEADYYNAETQRILDLILSWSTQVDRRLHHAAFNLKAPSALAELAVQKIWLLEQTLSRKGGDIEIFAFSKSGARQFSDITVSVAFNGQRYQGSGSRLEVACLAAFYKAVRSNDPQYGVLEVCNPLLKLLGIKTHSPARILNVPDNGGAAKSSKKSSKTKNTQKYTVAKGSNNGKKKP